MPTSEFKIFFRGDSRSPEDKDDIFKNGFSAKELTDKKHTLPLVRFNPRYFPKYVCISSKFDTAISFPYKHLGKKWVYVIAQDINQDDGHYINLTERSIAEAEPSDDLMFLSQEVEEHIVSHIAGEKILCAYPITVEESEDNLYLYTLEQPIENQQANFFLNNHDSLKSSYKSQLETYLSKMGTKQPASINQSNVIEELMKKPFDVILNETLDKVARNPLQKNAFYVTHKFSAELKKVPAKLLPPTLEKKKNTAFFDILQNSDGILFSSRKQFEHENLSFFKRTQGSDFSEQIKKEKESLQILADKSGLGKEISKAITSIFQTIKDQKLMENPEPGNEINRTTISTIKKMF